MRILSSGALRRALPGIALAAVASFAAIAIATGDRSPSPVYAGSHTGGGHADMAGMDMSGTSMQGPQYWGAVGGSDFHDDGTVRTYYIGADEVVWDYAPRGINEITGKPFDDAANVFVASGPGRIGSRYVKCIYRGYTDASFNHLQKRPAGQRYLGFLGPVIRAEVGDTIKVVFRNSCSIPTSIHPHGVFYRKGSEGAPYNDATSGAAKSDDAVPTGGRHTYVWRVPERAGPAPGDGSSVMWMYHGHTDEIADTYAGLMGPIEITRRGWARPDGSPRDVDREIFALFTVENENASPYIEENLHRFAEPPFPPLDDEEFNESNLMHSINGYVFGNQPMITMHRGQHVRWYVMAMGTEVDLHTPHWHGNTVTVNGMRMDTVNLLPASMIVADMVPDDPGIWLFHCHVNDHIAAGMLTRYRVLA
ncbi:MAG TPA: multicopper oxidase domain-containing protein [Gaiellales bacterium]|jgi:hephaestin|nr:multicopper oxidase domain-containing protein [Gaiellales bacterium]